MRFFPQVTFLLVFGLNFAFAIRYPVSPKEPVVAGDEKKENKDKKTLFVKVKLKLGSGDELEGVVRFPEKITFPHYRSGISYVKTLAIEEVKKIQILSYEEKVHSTNLYEYEPAECLIVTQKGKEYKITGIFSFLRKIAIETEDGKTTLFTIFADTWDEKTGWQEVSSKDRNYHRKNPHPKAVREIEILTEDLESLKSGNP